MLDDDVALGDLGEEVAVRRRLQPALRVGEPRLVLQVGPVEPVELTHVGEVEEPRDRIDVGGMHAEPFLEPREHRRRDRARDLEADDGAESALAQLALDCLEQVVGVVRDLGVAVAGEAERDALDHLHLGEEPREEVRDRRLERDLQAALADRDEAGEALGHLDACEALLARLGVAHDDTEAEREARDVRERLTRADRERRQDRDRSAARRCPRARPARRRWRRRRCRSGPLGGERGAELVTPEPRLLVP